ncbi:hypothetical protein ACFWAP_00860 [Streptomyces goshikiensis]|uniref:hypothetical protein n=1 Tax=Streptomyces goshikiensis TaxID=1942 RepID=UPI003665F3A8
MAEATAVELETTPTKKVTVYFTGKIEVEAAMLDHYGKARNDQDIVGDLLGSIRDEISEHLMYSDESREEGDLVQSIEELYIWDTTTAVLAATESEIGFRRDTAAYRGEDGDVLDEYLYQYDSTRSAYEEAARETLCAFADPEMTA